METIKLTYGDEIPLELSNGMVGRLNGLKMANLAKKMDHRGLEIMIIINLGI